MNYLDRNNIAAARLAGLQDPPSKGGLSLTSTQYLTALSILFVGYLLMQVPSNLFLNKIGKPAIYLPTVMIIWGIISAATAGAQSYGGLIAIRFFLGFVEAAYFPGCLFFLSSWYTRKELGFRTALLYSGSLLSGAFSGLISAGITNGLDGAKGLRAWRWLFIIEGIITIFIAFCAYFVLPNFPRTTSWLTEEERQLAVWRLDEDIGEDDWVDSSQQTFAHGFKLAVLDIKMWILVFMLPTQASSPLLYGKMLMVCLNRWSYFSASSRPAQSQICFPQSSQLWVTLLSYRCCSRYHRTFWLSLQPSSMLGMRIGQGNDTSISPGRCISQSLLSLVSIPQVIRSRFLIGRANGMVSRRDNNQCRT